MAETWETLPAKSDAPHLELVSERPEVIAGEAQFDGASIGYSIRRAIVPVDNTPVLIVKGFGGIEKAYEPLRDEVAATGRHAINTGTPRGLKIRKEFRPSNLLHPHRLASHGIRAVIEDVADEHDVEQVDLVAHSKAGRDVMWAAHHMEGRVRSIIFMGSVGLAGHSLRDLTKRVPAFVVKEVPAIAPHVAHMATKENVIDLAGYFIKRPHRTMAEIIAICTSKVDTRLEDIGRLGVKTAILEFANDTLLPPEKTPDHIKAHPNYNIFTEGKSGHAAPINQPAEVAAAIDSILTVLHTPK